jgi:hypothetical protein
MVAPAYPNSSPSTGALLFLDLFQNLTGAILLVVGHVPVVSTRLW